jgi:hypothetical protein
MVFEVDPDRPDIPAIARILSGMGLVCLLGAAGGMFLAVSGYTWVNDIFAMIGAGASFALALIFVGQAKTIELLAIVSVRVKSRFALDALAKAQQQTAMAAQSLEKKPAPITQAPKERIIHVPDDQAREQGFKVR